MRIQKITREEIINRILDRMNEGESLSEETRKLLIELSQPKSEDNGS